ncbi:MAG: hypothetical protein IPJ06_08280 [Saprospiraceae bacterium]|nr:hypothetical protein [Saprospiraceae bacterium]
MDRQHPGKAIWEWTSASSLNTIILSADSRQVYRGMDIGTAKPTMEEQARVQHHLIDIRDPDEPYNVGQFRARRSGSIDRQVAPA